MKRMLSILVAVALMTALMAINVSTAFACPWWDRDCDDDVPAGQQCKDPNEKIAQDRDGKCGYASGQRR